MCGIAGWISYGRDLRREGATVAAMSRTMACRGPDDEGMWADVHVALGHRRLAVIDLVGGAQPMTVDTGGQPLLVTTYSGEIYNHQELRAELSGLGHSFRTGSDTEVVLHAYLRWGEESILRLNGMYAFALWDVRRQELLLVRDRMGIKPLYYHLTCDGIVFGSEPKAILAHPQIPAVVDADGMAELLTLTKTPGHAVYRGMRELRPGHTLRLRRTGSTEHRYWALESHEHTDDLPTTITRVRDLLEDTVERQLIADVPLGTLLSGGLDSSAITALAARSLTKAGRGPVRSFCVDFTGHDNDFRPDDLRPTRDRPYAHTLAAHVGADHRDITLDTAQLLDTATRHRVLAARDLPHGFGDTDTSLHLLFKAVREHATVALSGECADEVFGGYPWFHDEKAVHAGTFPWLHAVRPALDARESILAPALLHAVDLPGYTQARYHEALAHVPALPGESGTERRMREVSHLHLTRCLQIALDRKDRTSMATGLEVRVPFCDHRILQYVFNTPWAMKTFDGREKSLLRAATSDILPASVTHRVKSPYPATQDPHYTNALRQTMKELLTDPHAPVRPLLDLPTAGQLVTHAPGSALRHAAELALDLNTWLTTHRITLHI
ncbi:asparagine synthase (glutamine-hydrolyzing) [Streptomyces sp. NPDC060366]|uniref:asparagine synthase (glutamine-hydrolyzing) n=1 Tax=Streptomyces sp. NPDC060366 TaxID=3347105 RepID=UPI00365B7208